MNITDFSLQRKPEYIIHRAYDAKAIDQHKKALPVLEKLFDAVSPEVGKKFRVLLEGGGKKSFGQSQMVDDNLNVLANSLARMTAAESVTTLNLLHALIATQLINVLGNNVKIWLDLLVQRFEVTKKIYEVYQAGLRKGEGANTSVRLYWLFALALSLFYTRTKEIKYLSTLLKVCDLLCSLPEKELRENITEHGLSTILVTEIVSVQRLIEEKGVSFAAE